MDRGGRTPAQQAGDAAEGLVERELRASGWVILGRRVRIGRAEIDLLAVDPGPPPALVAVEVRWRGSRAFGLPEETVDARKVGRLWAALGVARAHGRLRNGQSVPALPARVDIAAVEPGAAGAPPRVRHHRSIGTPGSRRTLW